MLNNINLDLTYRICALKTRPSNKYGVSIPDVIINLLEEGRNFLFHSGDFYLRLQDEFFSMGNLYYIVSSKLVMDKCRTSQRTLSIRELELLIKFLIKDRRIPFNLDLVMHIIGDHKACVGGCLNGERIITAINKDGLLLKCVIKPILFRNELSFFMKVLKKPHEDQHLHSTIEIIFQYLNFYIIVRGDNELESEKEIDDFMIITITLLRIFCELYLEINNESEIASACLIKNPEDFPLKEYTFSIICRNLSPHSEAVREENNYDIEKYLELSSKDENIRKCFECKKWKIVDYNNLKFIFGDMTHTHFTPRSSITHYSHKGFTHNKVIKKKVEKECSSTRKVLGSEIFKEPIILEPCSYPVKTPEIILEKQFICNKCGGVIENKRISTSCYEKCNLNYHFGCISISDKCLICEKQLKYIRTYNSPKDYVETRFSHPSNENFLQKSNIIIVQKEEDISYQKENNDSLQELNIIQEENNKSHILKGWKEETIEKYEKHHIDKTKIRNDRRWFKECLKRSKYLDISDIVSETEVIHCSLPPMILPSALLSNPITNEKPGLKASSPEFIPSWCRQI